MLKRLSWRLKLILIVGGILLIVNGFSEYKNSKVTPVDFDNLSENMFVKGMIVEGDLGMCFGAYAEEYKTSYGFRTSGGERYFYVIPVGEKGFMGYVASKGAASEAMEALTDATYEGLEQGAMPADVQLVHFLGTVCKMTAEDEGYIKDYLGQMGMDSAQIDDCLVSYYISPRNFSNYMDSFIFGIILTLAGAIWTLFPFIVAKKASTVSVSNASGDYSGYEMTSSTDFSSSAGTTDTNSDSMPEAFPSFSESDDEKKI